MKRNFHFALALIAVVAHLAAPVVAYAHAAAPMVRGDFCSASGSGAIAPGANGGLLTSRGGGLPSSRGGGLPFPASGEHHCAHAPCCAGSASDTATPSRSAPVAFRVDAAGVRQSESPAVIYLPVVIAAAQPRGPPPHA